MRVCVSVHQFSVKAQPTRGLDLPQDQQVFVQQARRQAPGWDGCRDRADGRNDLPQELQWVKPSQRASLSAVYHPVIMKSFNCLFSLEKLREK